MEKSRLFTPIIIIPFVIMVLFSHVGTVQSEESSYFVGQQSKAFLEQAKTFNPDSDALAYYLGSVHLKEGNKDKAIQEFESYISKAPLDSQSIVVREWVTVLKFDQAKNFAKDAVKRGELSAADKINENTVAIMNFTNDGSSEMTALSKGLSAMIITDLAKVPELEVVEREKMQALASEVKLNQSDLVDKNTASKTGKLAMAKNIVRGDLTHIDNTDLDIGSTVTATITAEDIGQSKAKGPKIQIFTLEKKIVTDILSAIGKPKDQLPENVRKKVDKVQTNNFEAFLLYGRGLDYQDKGMYADANKVFQAAADLDPQFELANQAMFGNPRDITSIDDLEKVNMTTTSIEPDIDIEIAPEVDLGPPAIMENEDQTDAAQESSTFLDDEEVPQMPAPPPVDEQAAP